MPIPKRPSKYDLAWRLIRQGWRLAAGKNAIGLYERRGQQSGAYQTRVLRDDEYEAFRRMTGADMRDMYFAGPIGHAVMWHGTGPTPTPQQKRLLASLNYSNLTPSKKP